MLRRSILPALIVIALPACSGEVLVPGETGSSTTSSGVTVGVGGSEPTGGVGGGDTTGGVGGSEPTGGVGGAPACVETHDTLAIQLFTWDGKSLSCQSGAGDYELDGSVEESTPGLYVLDSCAPNADCTQQLSKLSITAPNLYSDIPKGTFVHVHVRIEPFMGGCAQRVQIKNLPSWGGQANPFQSGTIVWFVGVDGGPEAFPDTPFQTTPIPLGCFPGEPMGCGVHDDFIWHFQNSNDPSEPGVDVGMGETAYWSAQLGGQFQNLILHNLRSYSIGACDGPVDLAYWAAHQYPLD